MQSACKLKKKSHSPSAQRCWRCDSSALLSNLYSQVALVVKKHTCQCKKHKRHVFDPWVRKIPWRRAWQPTLVFLPGKFHGQRSLAGYSPWGHKQSNVTE